MLQHRWLQRHAVGTLTLMLAGAIVCGAQSRYSDHAVGLANFATSAAAVMPRPADVPVNEDPNGTFSGFHGKLKKHIEEYTGSEFIEDMKGVGWYGWDRARPCFDANSADCPAGNTKAVMRVQAIGDAHHVPKRGSKNGIVVGRIENVGQYTDAATMLPSGKAQYYYIIERVKNQKEGRVRIAMISFDAAGIALDKIDTFSSKKPFQECGDVDSSHPHKIKRKHARGDFRTCDMLPPPDQVPTAGEQPGPGVSPTVRDALEYAWFSCNEGCCSAQWPPSARAFFTAARKKR